MGIFMALLISKLRSMYWSIAVIPVFALLGSCEPGRKDIDLAADVYKNCSDLEYCFVHQDGKTISRREKLPCSNGMGLRIIKNYHYESDRFLYFECADGAEHYPKSRSVLWLKGRQPSVLEVNVCGKNSCSWPRPI